MSRPRVLVTRAAADAQDLARRLEADGFEPVLLPLLDFEEVAPLESVRAHLAAAKGGWIVLTSPRAADALPDPTDRASGLRVAAVGRKTAEAARRRGWIPDLAGDGESGAELARHLVAADASEGGGAPRRVLWLRGERVAGGLGDVLRGEGYDVQSVVVYRTLDREPEAAELARLRDLDAACFASPSAVRALARSLPRMSEDPRTRIPAVALGMTTAAALEDAGWTWVRVAPEVSAAGLVRGVRAALEERGRCRTR